MKAHRNVGGNVVEIDVDIGLDGQPILPPDTTVDPRPEALPDHYVTVVGRQWVQIEIPVVVETLELKRSKALERWDAYRNWLLIQPVEHQGVQFDSDEKALNRLTQAAITVMNGGQLPPVWVTYDNGGFPLASLDELKALQVAVSTAFGQRFYAANAIRDLILAAETEAELLAITIPVPTIA